MTHLTRCDVVPVANAPSRIDSAAQAVANLAARANTANALSTPETGMKIHRTTRNPLFVLAAAAALSACGPQIPATLTIAVAQPLSGPSAARGQDLVNGAKLAIDELNKAGFKIAGKPVKRLDSAADKVTGKQVYGADLTLPGMLNAAVKESPVFGGKVKGFDAAKIQGMPGVKKVVQVGDTGVAVVADTWWHAWARWIESRGWGHVPMWVDPIGVSQLILDGTR
jgi:isoquinoline 1-oxidoreductase beta subunit